jgi:hypothetical protein
VKDHLPQVLDDRSVILLGPSQARLAVAQGLGGSFPFVVLDGQRREIRNGDAEQTVLGPPRSGRADLLVAHDPFEAAEQDEGDVQHGGDPEWGQIGLRELTGPRVLVGIIRDDGLLCASVWK